jgi:hypothetical protein
MRTFSLRVLAWLLLASLVACEQDAPTTLTQVTVRIGTSDPALQSSITELRVSASLRQPDGNWRRPVHNRFPAAKLLWPVDVPVVPRTAGESSAQFEVVAEAVQGDVVVAEARAITWFAPNRYSVLELRLTACPGPDGGFVCSPGCQGDGCDACSAAGTCERVMPIEPGELPSMPAPGAGIDATVGAIMPSEIDGGTTQPTSRDASEPVPAMNGDASTGQQSLDASETSVNVASEAGAMVIADTGPIAECDGTRPCSAGYNCTLGSCVSACIQTRCDPNATCSLVAGAPACACNRGYIATGSGVAVTCLQDVACEDLGCDINASCVVGANQIRSCVCKTGYTGSGISCAPVSCPAPAIENGSVTGGMTYNQTATYQCATGYRQGTGSWTRTCGSNMQWSGTQPRCDAITCTPAPTNPMDGTVSLSQGTTFGSVASYACSQGYRLQGGATRTCGDQGWSGSAPTCVATCGNGVLDTGEQCDPTAPASSAWTCMPTTCQLDNRKIYRACSGNADCEAGQACAAGTCVVPGCTSSSTCPQVPPGSGASAACINNLCAATCSSAMHCAPGLTCADGKCQACDNSARTCPSGKVCVLYSGSSIGRCF